MSIKCKQVVVFMVLLVWAGVAAHADLVGHWKFDEGSGTVAVDSSGNGNDGAFTGEPQYVAGQLGTALQFDGDDWVDCGDALDLTNELSIACWVNPSGLSGDKGWVARWDNYAFKSSGTMMRFTTPGVRDYNANNTTVVIGEWQHVAVTFVPNQGDGATIFYYNGVEGQRTDSSGYGGGGGPLAIGNNRWSQFYEGMIDDVQVYDHILTPEEVLGAMEGLDPPGLAVDPSPEAETIDVPREVTLSWTPGEFAVKHTVYLSASFADVNDGSAAVMIADNIDDATVDAGVLDFDQTYYWRVDEVNGAPDRTVFTGNVWSFTVEPKGIPVEAITATASAENPDMGPEKTIDGSGLNDMDQHSMQPHDMWLALGTDNWIQYEFDKAYKLHEMLVWNSNQVIEAFIGFGVKEATVETSLDGENWTALDGVIELAKATAQPTYEANTAVNLGGVMAQYVKISVVSAHGFTGQAGLAEVRFLAIPVSAREPQPTDGVTTASAQVALSWRSGREAVSHEVSLGTAADAMAVIDTSPEAQTVTDPLDYGTTYFWSVTEVNDAAVPAIHAGPVWTFVTPASGVVDDFESYSGDAGQEVFMTWFDGFGGDASLGGSQTGHDGSPFVETAIVNGGDQSLPVYIDNDGGFVDIDGNSSSPNFSEVLREFDSPQDWTTSGVQTLSIMFRGSAGLTGQLYCKIGSTKLLYDGDAANIGIGTWQAWNIDLSTVGGNLTDVRELAIGVEGGSSGLLYIDDIRLFPQLGELISPADPGVANLVSYYAFDGDLTDSVGGHHGTELGMPGFTTDPVRGQVLALNGQNNAVDVPQSADLNPEAFTVSLWANADPSGSDYRSPITSRDGGTNRGGYIIYAEPGNVWSFWTGTPAGWHQAGGPAVELGEWTHLAITYASDLKRLYVNGHLGAEGTSAMAVNAQQVLRIGGGASEGPGNYFWVGMIDDVRIYNAALSHGEVLSLSGATQPIHEPF